MTSCSIGIQCDDTACNEMKKYFEMFSKNNAFIQSEESDTQTSRSRLLRQASLVEEFEREKEELVAKFAREKASLKRAYENEIKEYEAEVDRLKCIIDCKMSEIESKYDDEYKKKGNRLRLLFEIERKSLKRSVEEQMNLIAEVESELKRILKRLVIELKNYEPSKCQSLENDLCSFNINRSCVVWLREIFNENSEEVSLKCERRGRTEEALSAREDELFEVGEVFRKQKRELTEIFMKEKKYLEEEITNNCLEYKKKLDREYEERMKTEMQVWQETIKEYEREVGILRYQREQMDRNYCLEIDRLKLETEREKVEICAKYMKEKGELRKAISDSVMNDMMDKKRLYSNKS